jgi:hypothetical protein
VSRFGSGIPNQDRSVPELVEITIIINSPSQSVFSKVSPPTERLVPAKRHLGFHHVVIVNLHKRWLGRNLQRYCILTRTKVVPASNEYVVLIARLVF